MAETLVSPGVLARENDQSFITQGPVTVGAAIIGPTVKGPVELPTVVTSYSQYQNIFGTTFTSGSDTYSYFTSIAAQNYFQNGGETLLVARVVSGSYTPATADIYSSAESGVIDNITLTSSLIINAFNITGSSGAQSAAQSSTSGTGTGATITASFANSESIATLTYFGGGTGYEVGDTITFTSESLGATKAGGEDLIITLSAANIVDDVCFTLESLGEGVIYNNTSSLGSDGALSSGTINNFRYQIQNSNTASGTFDLIIRQGNDVTAAPLALETWPNLSLDPKAENYIAKVIGDQTRNYNSTDNYIEVSGSYPNRSRYVRIKSVDLRTPNYFDNSGNPVAAYTSYLPVNGSGSYGGSFAGATGNMEATAGNKYHGDIIAGVTNVQGLVGDNYSNMVNLLADSDEYRFNVITAPGIINNNTTAAGSVTLTSIATSIINNTQTRGDSIYVLDLVPYGTSIGTTTTQANSRNTSYAASYWPWCRVQDPDLGKDVWVPASTLIPGIYANTDRIGGPWFAPAGLNRGSLSTVLATERHLTSTNRDTLYQNNVNPIAQFPGTGVVVYGQKTLQKQASALDRVNVRRLLIELKSYISQIAQNLVFEQNTLVTRDNFLSQVNPYLESIQQNQGLYAFRVIMDESNNTADVIDRNQMVGQIYIQPTKTAEFIYLDFNILPTGATFPS